MQNGKTKFTIENATRTRIVLADSRIHILGSFQNIRIARDAVCALIMGSPPVRENLDSEALNPHHPVHPKHMLCAVRNLESESKEVQRAVRQSKAVYNT